MRRLFAIARPLGIAGAAAALLSGAPTGAGAQSFFAGRGLGLVVEPQGARSQALGGVSLGLPGAEISWSNPAGAVGLPAAGLTVAVQTDQFSAQLGSRTADGSTTRFPLVMGAFPLGEKWAFTAGFGGFLDQRWAFQQADTLVFGTDSATVVDRVSSEGGVSRLRLGAAHRLIPRLSLGVGLDLYSGGVERAAGRLFPNEAAPRCCNARWQYSGIGGLASVDWNPSDAVSVSVSATVGGTLEAESQDSVAMGTDTVRVRNAAADRGYDLPAGVMLGASGRVSTNLLLAATASWTGWSTLDPALTSQGGARDAWSAGGGLEWEGLQVAGRTVPLRVGGRYRALPFRWGTSAGLADFASEQAFTGGTGLVLAGGATRVDLAAERGRRGEPGQGLYESFWRIAFSVSVLGQ